MKEETNIFNVKVVKFLRYMKTTIMKSNKKYKGNIIISAENVEIHIANNAIKIKCKWIAVGFVINLFNE